MDRGANRKTGQTSGKRQWRRPRVSSMGPLREAARRFCPPYEIEQEAAWELRIKLRDPTGRRPNLTLRHRHDRRLFLRANYTVVSATVPGDGPASEGELVFRFRGPLKRQRASIAWKSTVLGGDEWLERLREPLLRAVDDIEAVQSLQLRWSARNHLWRLSIETMSGSMVSGIMTPLPIAVPFDSREAKAVIAMVDALGAEGG